MGNSICTCKESVSDSTNEIDGRVGIPSYPKGSASAASFVAPDTGSQPPTNQPTNTKEAGYELYNKRMHKSPFAQEESEGKQDFLLKEMCSGFKNSLRPPPSEENKASNELNIEFNNYTNNGSLKLASPYSTHNERRISQLEIEGERIEFNSRTSNEEKAEEVFNAIQAIEEAEQRQENSHHKKSPSKQFITPSLKFVDSVPIHRIKQKLAEEGKKEQSIQKIVGEDKILSEDADKVLYEGEVLKYKPGINITYIKRWVQITKKEFKYYKDRYHSSQWLAKPLGVIPLNEIEKISRVEVSVGGRGKSAPKMDKQKYQFEIFPKTNILPPENNEEEQMKKRYSVSLIGETLNKTPEYEKFVKAKGKELMKVQKRQEIPPKNLSAWTNRQKEWELAESRLLFATTMKDECDKWILLLNWLVDLIKQEIACNTHST